MGSTAHTRHLLDCRIEKKDSSFIKDMTRRHHIQMGCSGSAWGLIIDNRSGNLASTKLSKSVRAPRLLDHPLLYTKNEVELDFS